jgi:serine/threonine protein kinase
MSAPTWSLRSIIDRLMGLQITMFDIKSTNVVLDRAGLVAKVCDFGLSKVMAGTHTQNTYVGALPPRDLNLGLLSFLYPYVFSWFLKNLV